MSSPNLNFNANTSANGTPNGPHETDGLQRSTRTMQLNCWLPATITVDLSALSLSDHAPTSSPESHNIQASSGAQQRIVINTDLVEVPDSTLLPRTRASLPGDDRMESWLTHTLSTVDEGEEREVNRTNDMVITVTKTIEVVSDAGDLDRDDLTSISSHESVFDILHAAPLSVRRLLPGGTVADDVVIDSAVVTPAPSRPPSPADSHISFSVVSATRSATPASPVDEHSPAPTRAPTPTVPQIFGNPAAPAHGAGMLYAQPVNNLVYEDDVPVRYAPPAVYFPSRPVTISDIYGVDRSDLVRRFSYDSDPEDFGSLQAWYVVTQGTKTGVFNKWSKVRDAIAGVPGAVYESVSTKAQALSYYNHALHRNNVRRLPKQQLGAGNF